MEIPLHLQRQIAWHLKHHQEDVDALEALRIEAAERGCTQSLGASGVHTGPGDPTGNAVAALEARTRTLIAWINAVRAARAHFADTPKAEYYRLVFDRGVGVHTTALQLHISRATGFAWRADIIGYTAILAAQYGALRLEIHADNPG